MTAAGGLRKTVPACKPHLSHTGLARRGASTVRMTEQAVCAAGEPVSGPGVGGAVPHGAPLMRAARAQLPVRGVELHVLRDLALPAVAVREQTLLVVVELFARFGRELEVGAFDDRIDRAGFLAQSAIDALHHVDVVARGAPRAVVAAGTGFDGDRLRRTDRLAQLAGDAAFLAVRIAAQRMLAAEARRDRPLLERIVQRRLRLEEIAHGEKERRYEFGQEQRAGRCVDVDAHS